MFDIQPGPKPKPFKSRFRCPANPTKREKDIYVTNRQIEAYQNLVVALRVEQEYIDTFGTFSLEALDAEKDTIVARWRYELWRQK
jgi:hypothetical protein